MADDTPSIRRPLIAAISWNILAELIRRHGDEQDLRVIEMHPGGGMYDLLVLGRIDPMRGNIYDSFEKLGSINLMGGKLRGYASDVGSLDIVNVWLQNEDPKDTITIAEKVLGLPAVASSKHSSRWIFGPRMFAALLGSQVTKREFLDARMCFADTSGYGAGVDRGFGRFRAIADIARFGISEDEVNQAANCWFLRIGPQKKVVGVYRMDGLLSSAVDPSRVHDLFDIYQRNRSIPKTLAIAIATLGI